jgi:hypothetical protein
MPKYRFSWTEMMYNQIDIEAESEDEANEIFSAQVYKGEPECYDMQFGDGPYVEELDA